jgi:hypothetical protein
LVQGALSRNKKHRKGMHKRYTLIKMTLKADLIGLKAKKKAIVSIAFFQIF